MTAHDFRTTRAAASVARPPRRASHPLDRLDTPRLAKRLVVFTPGGAEIEAMVDRARKDMAGVTTADVVRRVMSHNPDSVWGITRKEHFDAGDPRAQGFLAFLMLNEAGMTQLIRGAFDATDPDLALLAAQNERPAGIYVWVVHAQGVLAGGVPLALEKVWTPLYREADLYARAVTLDGFRFLEALGFRRGATYQGRAAAELHMFPRSPPKAEDLPLYDQYRGRGSPDELAVTVARTLEDLMRVISVRGAVYLAEQSCPYSEEFDGNDLCATHLIGYAGDEPAGCVRIRYFADFAKIERLAVRREFRKSGLAFQLVSAAMELCRVKGYRRLYGHAQKRLVTFWSQFGFSVFDGAQEFVFSDFDYVEMMLEDEAKHPQAISIGVDPYLIIRPEGRWHRPGVLERSAARPVTQPSVGRAQA